MKKTLLNYCGLLGIVAFLSYMQQLFFLLWHIRGMTGWRGGQ